MAVEIPRDLTDPEQDVTLRNGASVRVRTIRPDDEPRLMALCRRLSPRTVYERFFSFPNVDFGMVPFVWLTDHPRFHFHFTPTGASWLNLVERFFAEITRKRLRRGTFRSVPALIAAIRAYVRAHNTDPRPFIWTASAAAILRKIKRCKEALETGH